MDYRVRMGGGDRGDEYVVEGVGERDAGHAYGLLEGGYGGGFVVQMACDDGGEGEDAEEVAGADGGTENPDESGGVVVRGSLARSWVKWGVGAGGWC